MESHNDILTDWSDYVLEYNEEVERSKTSALFWWGLGQPQRATTETLEEVLSIMTTAALSPASGPGRPDLRPWNEDGFIMHHRKRFLGPARSPPRWFSRRLKASLDEMIAIRQAVGKPQPYPAVHRPIQEAGTL